MIEPKISVCMATHNGEAFVQEQLDSIITQLNDNDEIIIVDDASSDATLSILANFTDPRLKVFANQSNCGINNTFEIALQQSKNDIILLSDQDDIWLDGRAEKMTRQLIQSNALVISSNVECIDINKKVLPSVNCYEPLRFYDSTKHLKNIVRIFLGNATYFGCAMGFKREFLDVILPVPNYVDSHDLWIAMAANLAHSNLHYEDVTLLRRIHGKNASIITRGLVPKIITRLNYVRWIVALLHRLHKTRLKTVTIHLKLLPYIWTRLRIK